jgi:hypothetical protein
MNPFIRPSRCESAACVEVSIGDEVTVRSSRDPDRTVVFTVEEWAAWVRAIQAEAMKVVGAALRSAEAARSMFAFYEVYGNTANVDPGRELVSDGTLLSGIAELVRSEDSMAMDLAFGTAMDHEQAFREHLSAVDEYSRGPWEARDDTA